VLHVARLTDRTGRYYLDDLVAEPGPGGRPTDPRGWRAVRAGPGGPGRWTGDAAAGLGLAGPVAAGDLAAVLQGRAPGSARPLVQRRGTVTGYDLTFTAPKSASVLFALGDAGVAAEVVAAHDEAMDAAMGYVARRAVAVRRGSGEQRSLEPIGGVVGAAFTHSASRALDPHLHTHVVVANMGHGPDGRWTAVDGRGLYAHAVAAGQLYDAHLRHRLDERLGLRWTLRSSGRHEVDGIGPEVIGAYSSRRAEILGHLAGLGPVVPGAPRRRPSPRAARVAWAATRDPKDPGVDPTVLVRHWHDRARTCGVEPQALTATLGRVTGRGSATVVDEHRFGALLSAASPGGVARRDAVGAWAGGLHRGAPAGDVERCCDLLSTWNGGVGVGEERRAPAAVAPARHLLAALGPRPGSPRLLGVWLEAAGAVARYRSRWGVTDRALPLGVEGSGGGLAGLGTDRLVDHLTTTRLLSDARRELGLGRGPQPPERVLGIG
jgi:conjugative relaxase-like TrwC/TraI family protein